MEESAEIRRRLKQNEREKAEVEELIGKIKEYAPTRGSQLDKLASFDALPISTATKRGLQQCKFSRPTRIQIGAISHALAGRDILGAAKTGSGKTLAFLIPLLEQLYRSRWDSQDGLGALVISPTRELALQIFQVLRSIGKSHSFSAGLLIGGKNFTEEQARLHLMNIIICTPGRLLQHFEQTPHFDASKLEILVLDEADRILDMGFSQQISSILSYLPNERQTLLFSATQTKSVRDLARLSLQEPEYIAVHEHSTQATPFGLTQQYIQCPLQDKLDIFYSFLKAHLKHKIIVFLSTCRQVRFVHQLFCKLQPGVPITALHGKYKQGKRVQVYNDFIHKPAAVLFATDIASRGLDFPNVDWVVQFDCPENIESYIHRVGRTARYNSKGKALLLLTPSEGKGMLQALQDCKILIKESKVNSAKTISIRQKTKSFVAAEKELKEAAQKAFMSYVRSVQLEPNKDIFRISKLDLEAFSESLGLSKAPKVVFLPENCNGEELREELRGKKNTNRKLQQLKEKIKLEKEKKKKLREQLKSEKGKKEEVTMEPEEESFMTVKRRYEWKEDEDVELVEEKPVKPLKKIRLDVPNPSKIVFDEEGNAVKYLERVSMHDMSNAMDISKVEEEANVFAAQVAKRLSEKAANDREQEKQRIRAKHLKKAAKNKMKKAGNDYEDGTDMEDSEMEEGMEESIEDQEKRVLQLLRTQN